MKNTSTQSGINGSVKSRVMVAEREGLGMSRIAMISKPGSKAFVRFTPYLIASIYLESAEMNAWGRSFE